MKNPVILIVASVFSLCLVAGVLILNFSTEQLLSDEISLAAEGKELAEIHCARCHAVDKTGASKHSEAPPFRTFASKWPLESLEEALAEGIVTGHPDMPVFQFQPEQISALIEHLHEITGNWAKKTP